MDNTAQERCGASPASVGHLLPSATVVRPYCCQKYTQTLTGTTALTADAMTSWRIRLEKRLKARMAPAT